MFWNLFLGLCQRNHIKPNTVCKQLGFSNATATHWKNGKSPNGDTLCVLADYFNVSVDYLLGRTEQKIAPPKSDESDAQKQILIDNYDKMTENAQHSLVEYSNYMVGKPDNLKSTVDTSQMIS